MPEKIEEILEICLEKIKSERCTTEDCLVDYPQYQHELREMLPLAISLSALQQIKPSKEFAWQAANRLTDQLPDAPVTFWDRIRLMLMNGTILKNRSIKMPHIILSMIIALSLLFGGTFAVEASGPGDLLYELDRSVEQIRLRLTGNPEKALALRMQNASERLEEAYKKLQKGDVENALRAMEAYNKALDEINANEEGQVRTETRTMTQEEGALQQGTLDRIRLSQPEEAQARSAFQKALQRANMGLEKLFGPPEEAPQGPSEDVPQGPNSEDAQGPTEEAPQGPNEDAPQGPTDDAPNGPSNGKP
jgi:hypothetical protein